MNNWTRRDFLKAAGLTLIATGSPIRAAEETVEQTGRRRPNIIFILADDLGYTDLACYGSRYYQTPNIDRMAAEGVRFISGYTCGPNCAPTRAALMSGRYGPRTGIYTVGSIERFNWRSRPLRPADNVEKLPLDIPIVPKALKAAGYATAMFGKWHLGGNGEYHPARRGFDEAIVSEGKHFNFDTNPKVDVPEGVYLADYLTDKASDFIRRNREKPFFLYLTHFAVHAPHEAKKPLIDRFAPKPAAGGHDNPTYAAMIASVDESVGRILSLLDELKLGERTLVIFSSDNGGVGGYRREGLKQANDVTDNAPLRGGKGMLYEGGIRVPYIFRWKGTISPGRTSERPINSVDLYPTLLDAAQAEAPKGAIFDGVSYFDELVGKPIEPRTPLFWHFPGYLGSGAGQWRTLPVGVIREGDFKLLEYFEDGRRELYNLGEDIGEKKDLAGQMPDKVKQMHDKLLAWRKAIHAPMPTPNKPTNAKPKQKDSTSTQENNA